MLSGPLIFSTVREQLPRLPELLRGGHALDLSNVEGVDSAGLALLLEARRQAEAAGQSLTLHAPPAQLRTLAAFFGVSELLGLDQP